MKRMCLIGKFPPIEGGTSVTNYLLASSLGKSGVQVDVVTNAEQAESSVKIHTSSAFDIPPSGLAENVKVYSTNPMNEGAYIPWSKPYVTQLAALASKVVRQNGCDLILGSYLEPYAISSSLASQWTGVPYGFTHAGSDMGRLLHQKDVAPAYEEVIRGSDFVLSSAAFYRDFQRLGLPSERIYPAIKFRTPSPYFEKRSGYADLAVVRRKLINQINGVEELSPLAQVSGLRCDSRLPTFGMYGKFGGEKGTFDALSALASIKKDGVRFNVAIATQGSKGELDYLVDCIARADLSENTYLLPFLPFEEVGRFIKSCSAILFLENDFTVKAHGPRIPEEVISCSTCLITTPEIIDKQAAPDAFKNGVNCYIVDPGDIEGLARTLRLVATNPGMNEKISVQGYQDLSPVYIQSSLSSDDIQSLFDKIYMEVVQGKKSSGGRIDAWVEGFRMLCDF